ncbi:MAG: hypothetical protein IKM08_05600, partial [Clostridia bacterium]|nr:hypothetical protein [Clostridia bacterium]
MEENKNGAPRQGGHKHKHFRGHQNRQNSDRAEGGQRISVRPGNFNPPAQPGTPAAAPAAAPAPRAPQSNEGGESRNNGQGTGRNHNRHGRNRNRRPQGNG